MATLEQKVEAALKKKGMTRAGLGEALGYKYGYQGYHALFVTRKTAFTKKRRELAAKILGVDAEYFEEGNDAEARERATQQEFAEFLKMPVARECDSATLGTLERMTFGGRVPSRRLYRLLALVMMGYWSDEQIQNALEVNAQFDAMPPLPDPPKRKGTPKGGKRSNALRK